MQSTATETLTISAAQFAGLKRLILAAFDRIPEGVHRKGEAAAAITHRELCRKADAAVAPLIVQLRGQGLSLRAIAAELTRRDIRTRQEYRTWHAWLVARILQRTAAPIAPA
jgi:hypothetical protein